MTLTVNVNFSPISFSPAVEAFIMAKIDDLNAKLDAAEAAIATEKTESAGKDTLIASLRAQLAGTLSADDEAALEARIDALTPEISGIVTPDAPAEPVVDPSVPVDPNATPADV